MIRKLDLMHQKFGECNHLCGECENLISGKYHGKTLRKCKVYGLTHSEASDWAKRWPACGMFNHKYDGQPIIELLKNGKQNEIEKPLEGQISL